MRRFAYFLAIGITFFAIIFSPVNVFADEELVEEVPGSNTWLQISPTMKRLSLDPGNTEKHTINIKNTGEKEIQVNIYAAPYSIVQGTANLDFQSETRYTQISRWIKFQNDSGDYLDNLSIGLKAGEAKDIAYFISVPDSVPSGGQYAGIFAETIPDDTNGIATTTRVGMLVYAGIDGETHVGSEILNVKSNYISMTGKIGVSADIENTGNIDYQASLDMTISTLFGKELYNNTIVSSILPESLKKVYAEWDSGSGYGLYRLRYVIEALDSRVEKSHIVLVLPIGVLIVGLLLLALTIIGIVYLIKKKRRSSLFV